MSDSSAPPRQVVPVTGLSNQEFFARHAAPGRVGLAGGSALIDRTIRKMQRTLSEAGEHSPWSHAFLCSGPRLDGHQWVLESDLEIHRKQIRLGVQENRAAKYFDETAYPNLAILDFGLTEDQMRLVMTEALELLSGLARYSLRELVGTLLALQRPTLRERENLLAREGSLYCSAMVQHCYARAGIEFVPGVKIKNTTPQDIAGSPLPHTAYVLVRQGSAG
jgi:hypothetical protein